MSECRNIANCEETTSAENFAETAGLGFFINTTDKTLRKFTRFFSIRGLSSNFNKPTCQLFSDCDQGEGPRGRSGRRSDGGSGTTSPTSGRRRSGGSGRRRRRCVFPPRDRRGMGCLGTHPPQCPTPARVHLSPSTGTALFETMGNGMGKKQLPTDPIVVGSFSKGEVALLRRAPHPRVGVRGCANPDLRAGVSRTIHLALDSAHN